MKKHKKIVENLREVFDPEISVNIYDLGLIYDIDEIEREVTITHTLTSAFCPYSNQLISDIQKAGYVSGIESVIVNTTFDPPFSMDLVSEETKLILGWTGHRLGKYV